MSGNLLSCGKDRAWLDGELRSRGISDPRQVYLLSVDAMGRVYYSPRDKGAKV
jgi:uncharacterized membrane protein YcaP (DUF421 family)